MGENILLLMSIEELPRFTILSGLVVLLTVIVTGRYTLPGLIGTTDLIAEQ